MTMVSVSSSPTEAFLKPMDVEGVLAILAALTDPKACATRLEALMAAQNAAVSAMERAKELNDSAAEAQAQAEKAKAEAERMTGPMRDEAIAAREQASAVLADYQDRLAKLRLSEATHKEEVARTEDAIAVARAELAQRIKTFEEQNRALIANIQTVDAMKAELHEKLAKFREIAA